MNQTLTLPDDLVRKIEQKVEAGDYSSVGDVVRDALNLLEQHDRLEAEKLTWLRQAWSDGVASGDGGVFDRARFQLTPIV